MQIDGKSNRGDLFAVPGRFAVGQRLVAVADFHDHTKTKPVTVIDINRVEVVVQADDGVIQRFNGQGQYRCPYTKKITMWLEAG